MTRTVGPRALAAVAHLAKVGGKMPGPALAKAIGCSTGHLSASLDNAVRRGLLTKRKDPAGWSVYYLPGVQEAEEAGKPKPPKRPRSVWHPSTQDFTADGQLLGLRAGESEQVIAL